MKKQIVMVILALGVLVFAGGCGSPLANLGGGIATGSALSHTMTGVEKDLEVREAKLIELYNKGVEDGAQKEYLDQIEKDIYDTRLGKQSVATGKQLLGIDWKNPKQSGGAIGLVATLAYGFLKRKELSQLGAKYSAAKVGMDKFRNENPDKAAELFNDVGEARKAKKIA